MSEIYFCEPHQRLGEYFDNCSTGSCCAAAKFVDVVNGYAVSKYLSSFERVLKTTGRSEETIRSWVDRASREITEAQQERLSGWKLASIQALADAVREGERKSSDIKTLIKTQIHEDDLSKTLATQDGWTNTEANFRPGIDKLTIDGVVTKPEIEPELLEYKRGAMCKRDVTVLAIAELGSGEWDTQIRFDENAEDFAVATEDTIFKGCECSVKAELIDQGKDAIIVAVPVMNGVAVFRLPAWRLVK